MVNGEWKSIDFHYTRILKSNKILAKIIAELLKNCLNRKQLKLLKIMSRKNAQNDKKRREKLKTNQKTKKAKETIRETHESHEKTTKNQIAKRHINFYTAKS